MGVWHHRNGQKTEYGKPLNLIEWFRYAQTWRQQLARKLREAMK